MVKVLVFWVNNAMQNTIGNNQTKIIVAKLHYQNNNG